MKVLSYFTSIIEMKKKKRQLRLERFLFRIFRNLGQNNNVHKRTLINQLIKSTRSYKDHLCN